MNRQNTICRSDSRKGMNQALQVSKKKCTCIQDKLTTTREIQYFQWRSNDKAGVYSIATNLSPAAQCGASAPHCCLRSPWAPHVTLHKSQTTCLDVTVHFTWKKTLQTQNEKTPRSNVSHNWTSSEVTVYSTFVHATRAINKFNRKW